MSDEPRTRIERALAHVAPSTAASADLAEALATADQAPSTVAHRSLWIGAAAAAALIAAVGVAVIRRGSGEGSDAKQIVTAPLDGRAAGVVVVRRGSGEGSDAKQIVTAPLDGRTARLRIDAEGVVELDDLDGAPRARVELGGTPARASDGLDVLERALGEITASGSRTATGTSLIALELMPSQAARWRWLQWIMQVAVHPKVQIDIIRFGAEGGATPPIEQRLPDDESQTMVNGSEPVGLVVTALSSEKGDVKISLAGAGAAWALNLASSHAPVESGAVDLARATSELRTSLRTAAAGEKNGVFGQIEVPAPRNGAVTYEIVFAVLRTFREAGIDDVRFNGAAGPKPEEGSSAR